MRGAGNPDSPSARPRMIVAAIAAAVVLVVTGAIVLLVRSDGERARGPLNEVLPPRMFPAVTWTGDRLFVFGGRIQTGPFDSPSNGPVAVELRNDGALIEPATSEAEAVTLAPFDPPLHNPAAVATGRFVVVGGWPCAELHDYDGPDLECGPKSPDYAIGVYDLDEQTWKTVTPPAEVRQPIQLFSRATTDGRAVWQVGGFPNPMQLTPPTFWVLDPGAGSWTITTDTDVIADDSCVDGNRIVVSTSDYEYRGEVVDHNPAWGRHGTSASPASTDGHVLPSLRILDVANPDGRWQETPPVADVKYDGDQGREPPRLLCMGSRAMLIDYHGDKALVWDDTTKSWSRTRLPPGRGYYPGIQLWTGHELLMSVTAFNPEALTSRTATGAYDPASMQWRDHPGLAEAFPTTFPLPLPVWTGREVVGYDPGPIGPERAWPKPRSASIVVWRPDP